MGLAPPYTPTTWKVIFLTAGLIVLGLILWVLFGGYIGHKEKKLDDNIAIEEGKNAVIENIAKNQAEAVNIAANNTNQAINALRNSISKPANQFNGNGANDRFCADFPTDPSCH